MKRHKRKAIRERTECPKPPGIRRRESPLERGHTGEIAVHRPARNLLIGASQTFRPLLAPEIEIVLLLFGKLGGQRRASGVTDFGTAFRHLTSGAGQQDATLANQ